MNPFIYTHFFHVSLKDSILAVAGDEEFIRLFDCESQKCLSEFKAHENRIKALYNFKMEGLHILVTASSDGYIKAWNLDIDKIENAPSLLCEVNTKARLTCLAVWIKKDFETEQIPDEATPSSSHVHEAEQLSLKKKKICWTDSNKPSEGDDQKATLKRKSGNMQQKKKKLQRLK
uniref:Uncharacterized protein n=1 Tax=Micrurus corallinus TaxID=54390 RepID=A0A2D4G034_MICCO